MNGYTIKPSIEPNDKYEKAKQDVIQAIKSLQGLTSEQRRCLVKEALGLELAAQVFNAFPQLF